MILPEFKASESRDFKEKEGIGGVTNSWYTQQVVMRFFKESRFSGLKTK